MMNPVTTIIPTGYFTEGRHWREAHVRPLTGEDHLFLTEECAGLLPAQWVTEVLTRCVAQLGPEQPVSREAVRSLTVGDREALLLHLRRLSLGNRLRCLLACPSPECQEQLEIDVHVADLLLAPYAETVEEYECRLVQGESAPMVVHFRLPTGADQEATSSIAHADVVEAADLLLRQCVRSATSSDGSTMEKISEGLGEYLSDRMAELDPQAEIMLHLTCAACGATFSTIFDTARYVMQELEAEAQHLYREIHLLAYHYHWSATEILQMSTERRRKFLRLLEEQLAQGATS